jgi:hypothetical protein
MGSSARGSGPPSASRSRISTLSPLLGCDNLFAPVQLIFSTLNPLTAASLLFLSALSATCRTSRTPGMPRQQASGMSGIRYPDVRSTIARLRVVEICLWPILSNVIRWYKLDRCFRRRRAEANVTWRWFREENLSLRTMLDCRRQRCNANSEIFKLCTESLQLPQAATRLMRLRNQLQGYRRAVRADQAIYADCGGSIGPNSS